MDPSVVSAQTAQSQAFSLGEISVTDAHKAFGPTSALDGCSFNARRGEIHAVVGENGCGKSTLAKVVSGVLTLDRGSVSVFGGDPKTPMDARELGIATVFQEVLIANESSITDNLYVGADGFWTRSIPQAQKKQAATELIGELTGLDLDPDTLAGSLSLSVKQWLVIGRALLRQPKVLILDESSAALDLDATEKLFGKMRELRDNGTAVIIVTHRIAELIRISDRATVLRDGRDVGVLERAEITERNLLRLMTGESDIQRESGHHAPEPLGDEVVLRADGLSVRPGAAPLSFGLRRGELLGVAGLDGQGQDEFVRVLSGVATAAEGLPEVRLAEGSFAPLNDLDEAKRRGIAYVSGDRKREGILPNLSILENLSISLYRRTRRAGKLAIIDWRALSGVFDHEVERLSIKTGPKSNKITALSGGNQQKVMIARALALNPDILVLNDPARGIDVRSKREIYRQLRRFAERGNAVVYLSTELEEFVGLCSRVLVFRDGTLFDQFEGAQVEPHRILEAMFGQTEGLAAGQGVATEAGALPPERIRIVDIDKEARSMITKDDIGEIRIVEFGDRGEAVRVEGGSRPARGSSAAGGPSSGEKGSAAPPMRIREFDRERDEQRMRERVGPIRIVDADREADKAGESRPRVHDEGVDRIKIVTSEK